MATGDRSRQVITLTAAAGQVLLPTLWGPRFAEDEQPPNVIQPAPYTFGVWLPIFASSLGYAGLQARAYRTRQQTDARYWVATGRRICQHRCVGAAGQDREVLVCPGGPGGDRSVSLKPPAAASHAPSHRSPIGPSNATSTLTAGMLAAWGITATGVNLASMLASKGLIPAGRRRTGAAVGLLLGLGAAGAAAARSTGRPRSARSTQPPCCGA